MKYISIPTFIISFLIGMIYIYLSNPQTRDIVVYPTIDNKMKFQFIDKASNCFTFNQQEIKCPMMGEVKNMPIQV